MSFFSANESKDEVIKRLKSGTNLAMVSQTKNRVRIIN